MEFFEALEKRRSVRRFKPTVIPDEVIHKALQAALKAPNSSNLQTWEFYWVRSADKKSKLVEACLSQGAARTANHLIVAVSRLDTWKRNRDLLIQQISASSPLTDEVKQYYFKIIPMIYTLDPFGILALIKFVIFNVVGLFRPMFRSAIFKKDLFEVATKSTALACENFMLAIAAQGFGSCPMEGFDECRVKKLLKLNSSCHVVMVISVGDVDPAGIFGPQYRIDPRLVVHEI